MRILKTTPFITSVCCNPGDKLRVTWRDEGKVVVKTETEITESRILDTAVLVDFPPEEAKAFGLKTAIGCLAGEKIR
jgi:hypothetical protein